MNNSDLDTVYEGKYVLIRSNDSGVHVGVCYKNRPAINAIILKDIRRLQYFSGAFTLSKVVTEGCKDMRLSCVVDENMILGVCEVIPLSTEIEKFFREFPEYKYEDDEDEDEDTDSE